MEYCSKRISLYFLKSGTAGKIVVACSVRRTNDECKRSENNGQKYKTFAIVILWFPTLNLFHQRFTWLQCQHTMCSIRILNFYARYPHFVVLKTVWTTQKEWPKCVSRLMVSPFSCGCSGKVCPSNQTQGLSVYGWKRGRVSRSQQI